MTSKTQTRRTAAELPAQAISAEVLRDKYAKGDEKTIDDVLRRVARALAQAERDDQRAHWEARFLEALHGGFIPAGRIQSAAGTGLAATLINCFVQPVGDSIRHDEDGHPGIYTALAEAAETMRRGGGVGYDFSRIRPQGAWVAATRSNASGPVSYMRVFDRSCETVESAGSRRGAQMGVLALRPPGHRSLHPCQGPGRPEELQPLGGCHRRLHAGRARRRRHRTRAPRRARPDAEGAPHPPRGRFGSGAAHRRIGPGRVPARRRPMGLSQAAGARALGPGHALDLRPRRARRLVPRCDQPRQQPCVLRSDQLHESLRRTTAARLRLLLPRLDRPDAFRAAPVRGRCGVRRQGVQRTRAHRRAHARQRARCVVVAAAATVRRSDEQAPCRPWLHRPRRCAGDARPALRRRIGARESGADRTADARHGLRRLGRSGRRARPVSALQRQPVSRRRPLRVATCRRR